ncbi:hypothetical protein [Brevibacillus laterosporus]|uniref:hypothetical protein n=1 Tax=Brevibacillus laterosporus TaxID=1465 RepID=UPI000CE3DD7C|nr:hypothetical protein [Brevibacillus laterosporus]MED1664124.1 hypothetical protein [Brevibacillus laterosporus]MED1670494.1 hypothetical protein [Brevibacillus laterosporus]MED1720641.1 hypothetical protein [Brevibacillus laterosporus]PPA83732.1 hypothetical protein C4A76_19020 [Brevibacillus laterosporus]
MKKLAGLALSTLLAMSAFSMVPEAYAKELNKEDTISVVKDYMDKHVPELIHDLEKLKSKEIENSEEIEKVIEEHYKKFPAPQEMNNPSISVEDIFPEKSKTLKLYNAKNKKNFSVGNFMEKHNSPAGYGKFIDFNKKDGELVVYVGDAGEVIVQSLSTIEESLNAKEVKASAKAKTTEKKESRYEFYNGWGLKSIEVWAKGQFEYDGKNVKAIYNDGDWKKYVGGTILTVDERALGKIRNFSEEKEKYCEVYTRLRAEGIIGWKYFGITLNTETFEVYVGSTVKGSTYGGINEL